MINETDLNYLSPEIAMLALAIIIILGDLAIKNRRLLTLVTLVGLLIPTILTINLWGTTGEGFNGALVVDQFALFFKLLVIFSVFIVILSSQDYLHRFTRYTGEYYGLILLAATGMMLVAGTRELISTYLALELTTFSIVALAAFLKNKESTESAIKYLILSAVTSAVMLYGIVLVFGLTGSTHFHAIADWIGNSNLSSTSLILDKGTLGDGAIGFIGFLFILTGFGFKVATVPFHMWIPDVYEGAPTPITAYLSVASKAAGFAILLRVLYEVFQPIQPDWQLLIAVLAVISMFTGNLLAIVQSNIKRMLAYSTIAHAGYILIGVAVGTTLGQNGVLFYLAVYTITNLGAFASIIAISNLTNSEKVSDFLGVGRVAIFPALVLTIALVSLTGAPPTAGFIGKIYLFNAAVQSGYAWLAIVGVINSVISAYYYWKVIRVMYQSSNASTDASNNLNGHKISVSLNISLGITLVGILLLGIAPDWILGFVENAVAIVQTTYPTA